MDEHNGLFRLLKFEDGRNTAFPVEYVSLDDISNVLEAEIDLKLISFHIVGHENPEVLMSVLHLLDYSTLTTKQVYGFLALKQEVYLLRFEDSPHGNGDIGHELANIF